jgi:hypothetical protein
MTISPASARLLSLIDDFKSGRSAVEAFCKVVYYSPFPAERAQIPHYLGPDDIGAAVENALVKLGREDSGA